MENTIRQSLVIKLANAELQASIYEASFQEAQQKVAFYEDVLAKDEALKSLFDEVAQKGDM